MSANEAAERLRGQLLTARRPTEWMDTAENRLDAALAHERQRALEDAERAISGSLTVDNARYQIGLLLDAIASPSEPEIEAALGRKIWPSDPIDDVSASCRCLPIRPGGPCGCRCHVASPSEEPKG